MGMRGTLQHLLQDRGLGGPGNQESYDRRLVYEGGVKVTRNRSCWGG
jgi:hypothetical protein